MDKTNKTKKELLQEDMDSYILYLEKLSEENPELARKKARRALEEVGIIDKNGNLKPPYNGEKIHPDDFERGPKKIYTK